MDGWMDAVDTNVVCAVQVGGVAMDRVRVVRGSALLCDALLRWDGMVACYYATDRRALQCTHWRRGAALIKSWPDEYECESQLETTEKKDAERP